MRRILWALVALGFVAALVSAAQRGRVEARNRRVEITLDYLELRALAAAEGVPLSQVLGRFRAAGATSVAIAEDTVGSLEDARRITVVGAGRTGTSLQPEAGLFARLREALTAKTPFATTVSATGAGNVLLVEQPYALVRPLGIGLDPEAVAEVRAAGLGVVGRVGNWDGVSPEGIRWTLGQLKNQGVSTVIFSGDAILGFKGLVAHDQRTPGETSTETLLRDLGLHFGMVEFVKQKGDLLLARAAQDRTVRVHTVSGAEMLTADIPSNVQRFLLAARERNIRLLFVRLFTSEREAVKTNAEYVEKIARGLARGNLSPGPAHGYDVLRTPLALRLLMGVGLAGAWGLLLHSLTGLGSIGLRLAALLGGLLLAGLSALPGPKLAALAAACLYPTLALIHRDLLRPADGDRPADAGTSDAALRHALRRLLAASGITLLGAATVVGLLADRVFLIKADAFLGIKVAHLIPLLLTAIVYFLGLWAADRPWPRVLAEARDRITGLAGQPIRMWQAGIALIALAAVALLVLRSGNDPGVAVSGLELRVRGILDRLLYARPRFKEFLIGHPALLVALALGASGRPRWAFPLLIVGAVGQVSLLNTFCHLHTPLLISLWRALLGLGIGMVIGAAAHLLLNRLTRRGLASPR